MAGKYARLLLPAVNIEDITRSLADSLNGKEAVKFIADLVSRYKGYVLHGQVSQAVLSAYKERVMSTLFKVGGPEAVIQNALMDGLLNAVEVDKEQKWKINGTDYLPYVKAKEKIEEIEKSFAELDEILITMK